MQLSGKVTVQGVNGTANITGVIVAANNKLVDWDYSDGADGGETKDGNGNYINVTTAGLMAKASVTLIPFDPGSPGALATAKSNVKKPAPLAKVTIAGTGITDFDGDWHVARSGGTTIKPDNSGSALKMTIPLERFDNGSGTPAYLGDSIPIS